MEEHIPENRVARENPTPEDHRTTVVNSAPSNSGGWAVAVVIAVLVAGGIFYFASAPGDNVDPNATTSAIETQETAPVGGADTDSAAGTAPLEAQPDAGQPVEGAPAE